jgi:hypothetical protein
MKLSEQQKLAGIFMARIISISNSESLVQTDDLRENSRRIVSEGAGRSLC